MKRIVLPIMALLLIVACDKNETDTDVTSADLETIRSTAASGSWRVSYYYDSDKDETSDYAGYTFTFGNDGVLSATDGTTSLSGAWSVTDSDSNDDDGNDDIDFNIVFTGSELFEELSDDWDIVKYSDSKIELFDVSGGDGTTDYLTFEKL